MVNIGNWLVYLHVLSAFVFVGGIVGREATLAFARRQQNIEAFTQLYDLIRWFTIKIINPGSHAILIFGLLTAWVRGWPLLGILQGSTINWLFVSLLLYLTTIPLVFLVLIPRGKFLAHQLATAHVQGAVTPEVRAALDDPVVRVA